MFLNRRSIFFSPISFVSLLISIFDWNGWTGIWSVVFFFFFFTSVFPLPLSILSVLYLPFPSPFPFSLFLPYFFLRVVYGIISVLMGSVNALVSSAGAGSGLFSLPSISFSLYWAFFLSYNKYPSSLISFLFPLPWTEVTQLLRHPNLSYLVISLNLFWPVDYLELPASLCSSPTPHP